MLIVNLKCIKSHKRGRGYHVKYMKETHGLKYISYNNFKVVETSKFSIFMLKHPEYIMNNIESVLLSSLISDWLGAVELLEGMCMQLELMRDVYGLKADQTLKMDTDDKSLKFFVTDASKFTIFQLKYPELIKKISYE